MILGRVETQLETHQPEEQHGFRGGRRLEEHLVTTRLISDKVPVQTCRFGFSTEHIGQHNGALFQNKALQNK